MGTVISNLKARFGVDTKDFKNGLKDGEKAVDDFKDAAGGSIEKLADLFGVNMGAVNSALETSQRSLNFLAQSFKASAGGANVLSVALKVLKTAMIATGVGALVVALGSLVAYFTKSGRGADQFALIMAKVRSVIDNVISRLAAFGEGIFLITTGRFREGWEKMTAAVKGFGEEIKEDWKAAGELAKREDELYDRETALITSLEERRQKVAELRLQAKEQQDDAVKASRLLEEAMALEKSMTADQIALETERLAIMKEKLALQAKDPTDEQLREIAEQEANLSKLRAEGANAVRAMQREYIALTNEIKKAKEEQARLTSEAEKSWQNMIAKAQIASVPVFDITAIKGQLAEVSGAITSSMTALDQSLSAIITDTLGELAFGLGEFLGNLMTGKDGVKDFSQMVLGTVADMAVQLGQVLIKTGIAIAAVKLSLKSLNPVVAIAAGVALVAIGTAIKGALSSIANTVGSSVGSASGGYSGGGYTFDNRATVPVKEARPVVVNVGGEFRLKGRDLYAAVENEKTVRKYNT